MLFGSPGPCGLDFHQVPQSHILARILIWTRWAGSAISPPLFEVRRQSWSTAISSWRQIPRRAARHSSLVIGAFGIAALGSRRRPIDTKRVAAFCGAHAPPGDDGGQTGQWWHPHRRSVSRAHRRRGNLRRSRADTPVGRVPDKKFWPTAHTAPGIGTGVRPLRGETSGLISVWVDRARRGLGLVCA